MIIILNNAPIIWFLKRQATVETSAFGSEIVVMRIAVELVEGSRYKLQMMGVPINGSTNVYCDNESVVKNVTRLRSPYKKNHNRVAYHKVMEAIAAKAIRVTKEPGGTNTADFMTKLMGGKVFTDHCDICGRTD